ncbi:MAG: hypothetical protein ACXIT9_00120 [Nitritalea sp.]
MNTSSHRIAPGLLFFFSCFFFFSATLCAYSAQKKEKRIYILDGTASMVGFGGAEKVWHKVQPLLIENITEINEQHADLVLVVFADKLYQKIEGKDNILAFIRQYTPDLIKYTNIQIGWEAISDLLDPTLFNFVTFITDGIHNQPGISVADLVRTIQQVDQQLAKVQAFTCFVRLTEASIQPEITQTLKQTNYITFLDGIRFPVVLRPKTSTLTLNLRDENALVETIYFDIFNEQDFPEQLTLKGLLKDEKQALSLTGSNFTLAKTNPTLKLSLQPTGAAEAVAETAIREVVLALQSEDPNVLLSQPAIRLKLVNKPERYLSLTTSTQLGKARNYPAYLWGKAHTDTLRQQIALAWSADAKIANATAELIWEFADTETPAVLLIDGQTSPNTRLEVTSNQDTVEVVWVPGLAGSQGRQFGALSVESRHLDRTNVTEPLTFSYQNAVGWHPLKTSLFWIGICLIIGLVLWFLVLRNLIYKKFPRVTIQFLEPQFRMVKLKGAKAFSLTNKRPKQSALSTLFTGENRYLIDLNLGDELLFLPGKNKKNPIRLKPNPRYTIHPVTVFLTPFSEYTLLENNKIIAKIKIA